MITKCYNKNACGSKITVQEGDRKQEVYIWRPNVQTKGVKPTWRCMHRIYGSGLPQVTIVVPWPGIHPSLLKHSQQLLAVSMVAQAYSKGHLGWAIVDLSGFHRHTLTIF